MVTRARLDRLTLWLRWSWRDLRARWLQVLAIAGIVAIGTGIYAGLTSTTQWRRDSYDRSYAALDAHDVHVALTTGTFATTGQLLAVLDRVDDTYPVLAAAERLSVPTQVDASTDDTTILVSGRIIGVDLAGGGPAVDRIGVLQGRALTEADDATVNAIVDVHFADHYHLPDTGTARLGANREITYVGHGEAPEQFLSLTDTGSMFAEATFAVVYTSLGSAQELSGNPDAVNELVVRFAAGVSRADAAAALRTAFSGTDFAAQVDPLEDDRVYAYLYNDIDGDQRFFNIFAVLVLAGAAFAAFNLTGRMVEAQRREIGVGMAIGTNPVLLAIRPLLVALQIIAAGVLLGMAVGAGINAVMRDLLAGFMPLPVWRTAFQYGTFLRGALLGLMMPLVATVWPVTRALRVAPVDALRTAHLAATGGVFAPVLRRLRLPGDSLSQMPLRDVVRAPRRTVLTALGIATAVATLVAVIGMVDTFLATVDRGEREILAGHPSRMTVDLSGFAPIGSAPTVAITNASSIQTAVPALQLGGELSSARNDEGFDVYVTLLDFTNPLWVPTATKGSLERDRAGVVVSEKAARDLCVGIGDEVRLLHPRREGATGYTFVTSNLPVIAIHPNPYRFVVFMDIAHADLMNLTGIVNLYQVAPKDGVAPSEVQRELFGTPGIAAAQPVKEVVNAIRDFIGEILDILNVARGAVLLLALLIAFNSSSISADERRRQHATMFAFGVTLPRVIRMSVVESIIVGVLGTAVGIALGYTLLDWIVHTLLPDTVPDLGIHTTVSGGTILTSAIMGVAAVAVAPLFTIRRLRNMAIPDTLRVQE